MQQLHSKIDDSINFVFKDDADGYFEARYVRRTDDYFVCYLSSQKGCRQACRRCHLTITKQFTDTDATLDDYNKQTRAVFEHYDSLNHPAKVVHFGFMARGEPLANQHLLSAHNGRILSSLCAEAVKRGLFPRYCISTIMPKSLRGKSLLKLFPEHLPDFYYSIYSVDPAFRKKWLPNAMPPEEALEMLSEWQRESKKIVKMHWAFIKGENDRRDDVMRLCQTIKRSGLKTDFNIVRYNPYSDKYGEETKEDRIRLLIGIIKGYFSGSKIKVVDRVGFDVKASCGMFVEK